MKTKKTAALSLLAFASMPAWTAPKKRAAQAAPVSAQPPGVTIPVPADWNVRTTADVARIKSVDPKTSNEVRLGLGYGVGGDLKLEGYAADAAAFRNAKAPSIDIQWRSARVAEFGSTSLHLRAGLGLEPRRREGAVNYPTYTRNETQWAMSVPAVAALEAQIAVAPRLQAFASVGGGVLAAVTESSPLGPDRTFTGSRLTADLGLDWAASWLPRATAWNFGIGGNLDQVAGQSTSSLSFRTGLSLYL
jgi:hypothetical protein